MKIKTNEASGPALDWMVAKCEGWEFKPNPHRFDSSPILSKDGLDNLWFNGYKPSKDWSQGGTIIERENVTGLQKSKHLGTGDVLWHCFIDNSNFQVGPTPLIAAMRCYCASKLGDEVEVPEELQ